MATMRRRAEPAAAVAPAASSSPPRISSSKHEAALATAAAAVAAPRASSSSSCLRRVQRFAWLTLAGLLTWLAWQVGYLTFAYWWPRFAPPYTPTLERGVFVTLGHTTGTSQLLWSHCTPACRTLYCAQLGAEELWSQFEWELAECFEHMQVAVAFRPVQQEAAAVAAWTTVSSAVATWTTPHPRPHLLADTMVATRVFDLTPLQPCTHYEYQLLLTLSPTRKSTMMQDRFWTGPVDQQASCRGGGGGGGGGALQQQQRFRMNTARTAVVSVPIPDVRMVWGSCLGISPISNIRAFDFLASRLSLNASVPFSALMVRPLDFVLLLGDIVYTDIPALEDRRAYEQIWDDQAFRNLFAKVPFYGMFDDHELINDWTLADSHDRFDVAMRFYDEFVGSKNPVPPTWSESRLGARPSAAVTLLEGERNFELDPSRASVRPRYYSFNRGSLASFFVLDTRQYASPSIKQGGPWIPERRTKLGAVQLALLKDWLLTSKATFKFIASPVAWSARAFKWMQDGWAAYLHERDSIFDFIVANNITGVALLSADLHWAGIFHFRAWNLYEVTVSPIQSFGLANYFSSGLFDEEVCEYMSSWSNHFAQMEIFGSTGSDGQPQEPSVKVDVYKYQYGEPRVDHTITWQLSSMRHQPVNKSTALHTSGA